MRFRRALVSDVCVALQKAGNVEMSSGPDILGTPDSGGETVRKSAGFGACNQPYIVLYG
jgi:hypothetical protein